MKKNKTLIGVIIGFVLLIIVFISYYNSLITLEEEVNVKWSQVENQYQRRADFNTEFSWDSKGSCRVWEGDF